MTLSKASGVVSPHPLLAAAAATTTAATVNNYTNGEIKSMKQQQQGGSLPFKKRRFLIPGLDDVVVASSSSCSRDVKNTFDMLADAAAASSSLSSSNVSVNEGALSPATTSDNEKIAALALVAAAAAKNSVNNNHGEDIITTTQEKQEEGSTEQQWITTQLSDPPTALTSFTSVLAAAANLVNLENMSSTTTSSISNNNNNNPSLQQQHQEQDQEEVMPLMTSPLPNGCHGKTSRTNMFCRRLPCYNGSNYCKLHYHQYVEEKAGEKTDETTDKAAEEQEEEKEVTNRMGDVVVISKGDDNKGRMVIDNNNNSSSAAVVKGVKPNGMTPSPPAGVASSASAQHQDRRYTGCSTETRCKATTTRGRNCSYCAVNNTNYCYLHADYDTNPPPRRGGSNSTATTTTRTTHESSSSSVSSSSVAPTSPRQSAKIKNLKKRMADDSPYPLLSTLATDKWLNRKVIVSTGPLANHVGVVEKWGNGWVSVKLPGVGLHNRRSFELYLYPDDGVDESSPGGATNTISTKSGLPLVEVFDTSAHTSNKTPLVPKIKGCVSNDNDSSSTASKLSSADTASFNHGRVQAHEVTPLASCRVIGLESQNAEGDREPQRISSILFPTSLSSTSPNTVPESPVPSCEVSAAGSQTGDNDSSVEDSKTSYETEKEKSRENSNSPHNKLQVRLSPKSPETQSNENELRLVESLLLAQQGRVKNGKLGLLFGTAALERSRRHIQKPTWYGEPELTTSKKSRKRDRETNGKGGAENHTKRHRQGKTAVISTSDEENSQISNNSTLSV